MLLAIDAGNTNVVFALVEGDEIRQRWRIATDPRRTGDEYAVWLFKLLEIAGLDRSVIDSVVIAKVVPRALHHLEVLARKYFGQQPVSGGTPGAQRGMGTELPAPEKVRVEDRGGG